jgi:hypothetical protein
LAAATASSVTSAVDSERAAKIDVARLQLAGGGVAPVGHAHRPANPEAPLGEVEPVADRPPDPVVDPPDDEVGAHASLHDEVFDQATDLVVDQGGHDGGLQAEAFPEAAGDVVFPPAFPGLEGAGRANAALTRVEPEHDLAERDLVEGTGTGGLEGQRHGGSRDG